jgi:hypothetical protein
MGHEMKRNHETLSELRRDFIAAAFTLGTVMLGAVIGMELLK